MNCPDVGTWRTWLDDGRAAELEAHRAGCARCRALVGEMEADATHAASALGGLAPAALPFGAALRLARARLDAPSNGAVPAASRDAAGPPLAARAVRPVGVYATVSPRDGAPSRGASRWRLAGVGLAAALLVGAVATVPAAQTAAAGILAQFRSKSFVAVPVDESQGRSVFGHLKDLGVVQEPRGQRPERVGSLAEASARVGFAVVLPDPSTLPSGLSPTPSYEFSPATEVRFTVQKAKVREFARRAGHPEFVFDDRYDGATLVVHLPAAVLLEYRGASPDRKILIGQSGEVTAEVDGKVGLDELRSYLLSVPGLPDGAVRDMRALQNWEHAFPIPVPAGINWQNTTVRGNPALVLADGTGLGSGVIWNRNGRLYGVAGNVPSADVLRLANGLP